MLNHEPQGQCLNRELLCFEAGYYSLASQPSISLAGKIRLACETSYRGSLLFVVNGVSRIAIYFRQSVEETCSDKAKAAIYSSAFFLSVSLAMYFIYSGVFCVEQR